MSDLEALRDQAERLKLELHAHDVRRDELAEAKRAVDAALFEAEMDPPSGGDVHIVVDAAAVATFGDEN